MKRSTFSLSRAAMRTIVAPVESGGDGTDPEPQEGDEGADPDPEDDGDDDPGGSDDGALDSEKLLKRIRDKNSENRALRERTKAAEEKAKGADESTKRATELEAENLRLRVAITHGIPEKLISRLQGSTEEEILKDAEELMEIFEAKKPPTRKPLEKKSPSQSSQDNEAKNLDDLAAEMFRD